MIVFLLVLVAVVVGYLRHRAHKALNLSGTNHARPVFSVEPPTRRMGSRRTEAL